MGTDKERASITAGTAPETELARLRQRVTELERQAARHRQVEDELRKLSRAVEQSPSMVVITDASGRIEYVNPKFERITGYTEQEAIGQNPRILQSGQQDGKFYRGLWDTLWNGQEWRGEFSNRKKNGDIYWEFASISPIRDQAGEITHFVKVAEDVTRRRQAEEALRQYADELEAQNAELDAFAHTVAHDLKNPLSLVLGFAEALAETWADLDEEETRRYLRGIARNAKRLGNIVDELLILAGVRKQEIEPRPLEMDRIVAEAVARLDTLVQESRAEIVVQAEWPVALGYGPWIEEVWANYLSNAMKYGGEPPRIEVGSSAEANGTARFWVRDHGPGLTPEEQDSLFVPFTQLGHVRARGHGLGLSIVRRIVEKLGGEVGVESAGIPGQGSTFYFALPLVKR
ncbi:MAG: PAS domain S-box protein [Anaerolineae bacterium]|jgi:PAS domain S-box-containing protein